MENRKRLRGVYKKIRILGNAFMGNLLKIRVIFDIHVRRRIALSPQQEDSIIISLTSYGVRIQKSLAYTIYSLLKQDIRAEKIVVWLDQETNNEQNLPYNIKFLRSYNVDILFCKDLRSYKKIIFSLSAFADKNIITVDDDIYYTRTFVSEFVKVHQSHPTSIITGIARVPFLQKDGQLSPYQDWPEIRLPQYELQHNPQKILPVGMGGVLYPVGCFDEEVFNEQIFMSLCPKADDIWLYLMGLRKGNKKVMVTHSQIKYYLTDFFRQLYSKDRLTATNRLESENDTQMKALLTYYQIKPEETAGHHL